MCGLAFFTWLSSVFKAVQRTGEILHKGGSPRRITDYKLNKEQRNHAHPHTHKLIKGQCCTPELFTRVASDFKTSRELLHSQHKVRSPLIRRPFRRSVHVNNHDHDVIVSSHNYITVSLSSKQPGSRPCVHDAVQSKARVASAPALID